VKVLGHIGTGRGLARLLAGLGAVLACLLAAGQASAGSADVVEFPLPLDVSAGSIAAGPEGALWFTMSGERLGRITTAGKLSNFALPAGTQGVQDIAAGPDGNLWLTTQNGVDRAAPGGEVAEFRLPGEDEQPGQIAAGPDGNLWFTLWTRRGNAGERGAVAGPGYIARITPAGEITRFQLPDSPVPRTEGAAGIVAGPDGALWFTDPATKSLGRITTAGQITERRLPVAPRGIATGADGSVWFTATADHAIGRVDPSGQVTEFPQRRSLGIGPSIVAAVDGNFWFAVSGNRIGRITPAGQTTFFAVKGGSGTADLAPGPDGNVWFTTIGTDYKPVVVPGPIGRIAPGLPGIEVNSTAAAAKQGRVELELACAGGAGGRGCSGRVGLGSEGRPSAESAYTLPAEARRTVAVPLPRALLSRVGRERFLREGAFATVDGGETATATIVLRRQNPLQGVPRPGHSIQIPLPSENEGGAYIASGLGALWLTEDYGNRIDRITPQGRLTSFPLPEPERLPEQIVAGPDRRMWFTENGPRLGRIASNGEISELSLPGEAISNGIATGPDGNVWVSRFTSSRGSYKGEIDIVQPDGSVRAFPVPGVPAAMVSGPGHSLWFVGEGGDHEPAISRITLGGKVTEFPVPGGGYLGGIAAGPDGNLWFVHAGHSGPPTIGRMTPRGHIVEFPIHKLGRAGSSPVDIVAGPDGNLWFTEQSPSRIGRITPRGKVTQVLLPTHASAATGIAVGPDGNLWFAQWRSEEVGVMAPWPRAH
jgi:streptogramin lyase